jgi:aminoglycoside phosphotransferase (APT) family kinase protein
MISPDQAARLAASHLGGRLRAEPFGDGRFSETFLLQSRDSTGNGIDSGPHSGANPTPAQEYIMRIAPSDELLQLFYEYRMMRQEPSLHSLIRSRTSLPVPEIRAHDFSRSLINRDYLIMPRLPGTPLSSAALSGAARDHALFTWGSHIRTLHGIQADPGHFGYLGEHRPMEPQPSWPQAFLEMYRLELEDIRRCGIYGREECDYALSLLRENMTSFPELPAAILCHGDIWVTNLLVDSAGAVTGLIDFDRAGSPTMSFCADTAETRAVEILRRVSGGCSTSCTSTRSTS